LRVFTVKIFLRVAAVLVALGNWYVLTTSGNPAELARYGWSQLLLNLFIVAALGVLIAEALVRLMRPALEGAFFARYVAIVVAVCLGGIVYGAMLAFAGVLSEDSQNVIDLAGGGLVVGFLGAIFGGALGLAEGLVLGLPVAAILGLFRKEG